MRRWRRVAWLEGQRGRSGWSPGRMVEARLLALVVVGELGVQAILASRSTRSPIST